MKVGSDDLEAVLNDEDLERYYQEYRLTDDPRVTSIGRFLRKTSLDELPQLINVLEGSMSLVGPRPVMEKELENYSPEERYIFLSVKPGITGLWQVSDRNETTYQSGKRQQLELYYVKNVSLLSDICILLKTPVALLKRGV
jgi:lipopolysaccharide/colanic/teichoic acid biosynthesis glycosyltransferase